MLKRAALFLLIILFASFQKLSAQEFSLCKIMEHEANMHKGKQHFKSAPQTAFYDVTYYRLELELDPSQRYVKGMVTAYFHSLDSNLTTVVFDLSAQLTVDSVRYHGLSIPFSRNNASIVSAQLPAPLTIHTLDSIAIYYQGIPSGSTGSPPFARAVVNNQEVLWTLSEPYGAQEWWPCKNSLTDKADSVEVIVSTPKKNKVASNGLLLAVDTNATIATYHWKTTYPMVAYLVAVAVSDYDFYEEYLPLGSDSLLMQHFLFKNQSFASSSSENAAFLHFFDSLFGQYPFIKEKYGHASFTFGGGMEHQTMSFMGSYGGELKAHELAHQWFGNKITCGSWKDLWLNEGFATYLTALTYEFGVVHNPTFYSLYLSGMESSSLNHPNGSVYRSDDTLNVASLFNNQVYAKGGFTLHMLRWLIGDSAFFQGARNYMSDSSLIYGFATTEQLKHHFEISSGQNLSEFFADWVYGKGFPSYRTNWIQQAGVLHLSITQTQSDHSVPFFNLPIPYHLYGNNWDTVVIVDPTFSGESFSIPISQTVNQVIFDEDNWILNQSGLVTNLTEKDFLNQLKLYPNPATTKLYFEAPNEIKLSEIIIKDANGRIIMHSGENVLDISHLESGIYFALIRSKHTTVTRKFFVLK